MRLAEDEYRRYRVAQAAAYMEHIRKMRSQIRMLQAEISERRELASGLRGIDYADSAPHGAASPDKVPDAVIRIAELTEELQDKADEYVDERDEAMRALEALERPEHAEALAAHYMRGIPWQNVCDEMGYTWDGMMSLRRRALDGVWESMPAEWRHGGTAHPNTHDDTV